MACQSFQRRDIGMSYVDRVRQNRIQNDILHQSMTVHDLIDVGSNALLFSGDDGAYRAEYAINLPFLLSLYN